MCRHSCNKQRMEYKNTTNVFNTWLNIASPFPILLHKPGFRWHTLPEHHCIDQMFVLILHPLCYFHIITFHSGCRDKFWRDSLILWDKHKIVVNCLGKYLAVYKSFGRLCNIGISSFCYFKLFVYIMCNTTIYWV